MTLSPTDQRKTRFRFDPDRFKQLVHYLYWLVESPRSLDVVRTNRILWYTELTAYLQLGRPLTGATYAKQQHNAPVAKPLTAALQELVKSGDIAARKDHSAHSTTGYFATTKPIMIDVDAEIINIIHNSVNDVLFISNKQNTNVTLSLDKMLHIAHIGETIPYYVVFGGNQGLVNNADLYWASRTILDNSSICDEMNKESDVKHAVRALYWHLQHDPSVGISMPGASESLFIYKQSSATNNIPDIVALYKLILNELVVLGIRMVPVDDEEELE